MININSNTDIKNNIDICIISLVEHSDRREKLVNALLREGFHSRVSLAINGKTLSAADYFRQFKIKSSRWFRRKVLTPSELGCWLSHRKALQEFLAGNKSWLLILEDDVRVDGDLAQLMNDIHWLEQHQQEKQMVMLPGGQNGLASFKRVIFRQAANGLAIPLFGTHRWLYRTCCYLLSRDSAQQFILLMNKSSYIADDWAYILKNTSIKKIYYKHYFSHPESLTDSSIEAERLYIDRK